MKKLNYYKLLLIPALIILALLTSFCTVRESQVDSKEVAEEKNREKFTTPEAKADAKVVTDAVAVSLAQIRLADLALEHSRDPEIKRVASELKNDHSILLSELTAYSTSKVITIPLTESNKARKEIQKLEDEKEFFNKKWCDEVRDTHQDAIAYLERNQNKVSDQELKTWVNSTLPKLRKHLDMISACHNRVK